MITCTKLYTDFPFAHRQHLHDGHCKLIHGHNWAFEFTFGSHSLDPTGFVIDFGKLKWLRDWLNELFDHTLVLNASDPSALYLETCLSSPENRMVRVTYVEDCSCEGLARWLFTQVNGRVRDITSDRVFLVSVRVFEDSKNHATYQP